MKGAFNEKVVNQNGCWYISVNLTSIQTVALQR